MEKGSAQHANGDNSNLLWFGTLGHIVSLTTVISSCSFRFSSECVLYPRNLLNSNLSSHSSKLPLDLQHSWAWCRMNVLKTDLYVCVVAYCSIVKRRRHRLHGGGSASVYCRAFSSSSSCPCSKSPGPGSVDLCCDLCRATSEAVVKIKLKLQSSKCEMTGLYIQVASRQRSEPDFVHFFFAHPTCCIHKMVLATLRQLKDHTLHEHKNA